MTPSTGSPVWHSPWRAGAFRGAVEDQLLAYVDARAAWLADLGPDAHSLVERLTAAARATVTGGKRFRAAFCYWGFHAVPQGDDGATARPDPTRALLQACGSLELLHASALVHDDYMDLSDTRRGQPAVHRAFADRHRAEGWSGDPEQYGASAAILLGDLLLSWSDEMLRTCGLEDHAVRRALAFFDKCRTEVVTGQFLDVSAQARGTADVDLAMTVLRFKSAKYSVERPLHIGAALAGADEATLAALSRFGLPLGEAFQLRDDLLGVFGDPAVTGKPAGDDLTEGKRTVLVALALDALPPADAKRLDTALGRALPPDEVAALAALIEGCGARAQVETVIGELTDRALGALEAAPLDPTAATVLGDLAAAATQRTV